MSDVVSMTPATFHLLRIIPGTHFALGWAGSIGQFLEISRSQGEVKHVTTSLASTWSIFWTGHIKKEDKTGGNQKAEK